MFRISKSELDRIKQALVIDHHSCSNCRFFYYTDPMNPSSAICRKKPVVINFHGLRNYKTWTGTLKRPGKGTWDASYRDNDCSLFSPIEDLRKFEEEGEKGKIIKTKSDFIKKLKELQEKKKKEKPQEEKTVEELAEEYGLEELKEEGFESLEELKEKEIASQIGDSMYSVRKINGSFKIVNADFRDILAISEDIFKKLKEKIESVHTVIRDISKTHTQFSEFFIPLRNTLNSVRYDLESLEDIFNKIPELTEKELMSFIEKKRGPELIS